MADDKKKLPQDAADEDGQGGWTGSLYDAGRNSDDTGESGGKTSAVEFRFHDAAAGLRRDDLLGPNEMKRLLLVHEQLHKERVDKQKMTREERAAKKAGRYVSSMESKYRQGLGGGGGSASRFKKHPISDKAQFSGIDKQVVAVPSLNEAETNSELKDKLENRLENKYRNVPRFNPRPRPG